MGLAFDNLKCPGCKEDLGISLFELFFVPEWECHHCGCKTHLEFDKDVFDEVSRKWKEIIK